MRRYSEPEWLKLVRASENSGLSESELFRACVREDILSVHIVKPGKRKGIRLINKASLDAYIRSFLPGGERYQKTMPEAATH